MSKIKEEIQDLIDKYGYSLKANQICNLIASSLPEPKTLGTWDYYHKLKKELEG